MNNLRGRLRCGTCAAFNVKRLERSPKLICSENYKGDDILEEDVKETTNACSKWKVNSTVLNTVCEFEDLNQILDILGSSKNSGKFVEVLLATLLTSRSIPKPFSIGEIVYLNLSGLEYIESYFEARILFPSRIKGNVIVFSDGLGGETVTLMDVKVTSLKKKGDFEQFARKAPKELRSVPDYLRGCLPPSHVEISMEEKFAAPLSTVDGVVEVVKIDKKKKKKDSTKSPAVKVVKRPVNSKPIPKSIGNTPIDLSITISDGVSNVTDNSRTTKKIPLVPNRANRPKRKVIE